MNNREELNEKFREIVLKNLFPNQQRLPPEVIKVIDKQLEANRIKPEQILQALSEQNLISNFVKPAEEQIKDLSYKGLDVKQSNEVALKLYDISNEYNRRQAIFDKASINQVVNLSKISISSLETNIESFKNQAEFDIKQRQNEINILNKRISNLNFLEKIFFKNYLNKDVVFKEKQLRNFKANRSNTLKKLNTELKKYNSILNDSVSKVNEINKRRLDSIEQTDTKEIKNKENKK